MKQYLLSGLLVMALALSACQNESDPVAPVSTSGNEYTAALKTAEQLDLTTEQYAFVDEMFYLDEDMSVLLEPDQLLNFRRVLDGLGHRGPNDVPGRPGAVVDMDAMLYFKLILRACPDLTPEQIAELRRLIAESTKNRATIIRANMGDREAIARLLAAEHAELMEAMKTLIGP